jgi:hypothetical protein
MTRNLIILPVLLQALALSACEADDGAGGAGPAAEAPPAEQPDAGHAAKASPAEDAADARSSPGKPTAPITIDYEVIGTPVVGQPVSINLDVKSSVADTPVTLSYRINDASSLAFPEAQPRRLPLGTLGGGAQHASQQVTVVPQREGRAYLNVSAEVETADGTLLKSIAIPIQVGTTPGGRQANGEVVRDAEGEPVISLPADDR